MKIPKLKNGHISVVSARYSTGHILNKNGDLYRNDSDENPFWEFESRTWAENFILEQLKTDSSREFIAYDCDGQCLLVQDPKGVRFNR